VDISQYGNEFFRFDKFIDRRRALSLPKGDEKKSLQASSDMLSISFCFYQVKDFRVSYPIMSFWAEPVSDRNPS